MAQLNDRGEVRAAGGVPCRAGGRGRIEVLLVHRAHYGDWTIPKGKVEEGESDEACALREVEEESGLRCTLGVELPTVRWVDRLGRPKVSRYWALEPAVGAVARAQHEVDAVEWLELDVAIRRLSYARDAVVLEALAVDETAR